MSPRSSSSSSYSSSSSTLLGLFTSSSIHSFSLTWRHKKNGRYPQVICLMVVIVASLPSVMRSLVAIALTFKNIVVHHTMDLTWLILTWPDLTWPDLTWLDLIWHNLTWMAWLDLTWLDFVKISILQTTFYPDAGQYEWWAHALSSLYWLSLQSWHTTTTGQLGRNDSSLARPFKITAFSLETSLSWWSTG